MIITPRIANLVNVLRRHMSALALDEKLLFPRLVRSVEVSPTTSWGYSMQIDVSHDEKIINIETDSMSHDEKRVIFLQHKKMLREEYPNYFITEKHT